jgi:hypothetical protein
LALELPIPIIIGGTIEKPVNLNWGEIIPFVELMKKYYDLPVYDYQ